MKTTFNFRGKVWLYPGMARSTSSGRAGSWHFVSLPKKQSNEIKNSFDVMSRGFGSLPVIVTIGKTSWKTSIFPDKKSATYILPIKADVRKKEGVTAGKNISFSIVIRV